MASKKKDKDSLSSKDLDEYVVKESKWNYKDVVPNFIRNKSTKSSKFSFNLFGPKSNDQKAASKTDEKSDADSNDTNTNNRKEKIGIIKYNPPNYNDNGKWCYVIENVFSNDECDELIQLCDKYKSKHHVAMLRASKDTSIIDTRSRNHQRLLVDSKTIANELFVRIKPFLPQLWPMVDCFDPKCDPNLQFTNEYIKINNNGNTSSKDKSKDKSNDNENNVTFEWQHSDDKTLIGFNGYIEHHYKLNEKEKGNESGNSHVNDSQNDSKEDSQSAAIAKYNELENASTDTKTNNKNEKNEKNGKNGKNDKKKRQWKEQCRKVLDCNERLRFLKYNNGEYFKPHYDGAFVRSNGEKSFITVLLYLNDGFTGGETTLLNNAFFETKDHEWGPVSNDKYEKTAKEKGECVKLGKKNHIAVTPKKGAVLLFQHDIFHEGTQLISGTKYLIRTDVMYSSKKYDMQ